MLLRFLLLFSCGLSVLAQDVRQDQLFERIFQQEQRFIQFLNTQAPLVETYIQEIQPSTSQDVWRPSGDHYYLGRAKFISTVDYMPLVEDKATSDTPRSARRKNKPLTFLPRGFVQMAVLDLREFNSKHYHLEYVRREFLGDLRTLVFETTPLQRESGRFTGRIWVEEASAAIVRFNGTYLPTEPRKRSTQLYFHFDSWRSSPTPGVWVPTRVYIEEQTEQTSIGTRFKAQTRFWNYASAQASMIDELTQVLVEQTSQVTDHSAAQDFTPFESQRAWERQAEENVLARLEKSGLLAPPGPVDKILDTVVNNLIISGNLNVDAHCRVLLTTPLETFSIGHTIVISRGLIDVLPDEASLALALADELAHIALGHRTPTQFSFTNQTMLNDAELLSHLRLERSRQEMNEAGAKTIEIMRASPYQKSVSAGLFLKALVSRAAILPRLLRANVGNQVANTTSLHRLAEFMDAAPELEENKLEQIAALPLGSRIKLNPWNDQISLLPTKPVSLISTREKIPFEIAPIFEYLTLAPAAEAPH